MKNPFCACVCLYTRVCTHMHIWIYEIVLFTCTVYKAIMNLNVLFYLPKKKFFSAAFPCRTVTWSSTGCLTASAKNAMTAVRNLPPSGGGTTVDFVGRSSVVDAAIRKSLENSWATQVGFICWAAEHSLCAQLCLDYCILESGIC